MGKFKERDWVVPDHLPELLREQAYQPIPPDDEDRAFLHAAGLLRTVGGALQTVPVRVEVEPERFITVGYRFRWTLFAPAQHLPKDENGQEPEPSIVDPEPVEA